VASQKFKAKPKSRKHISVPNKRALKKKLVAKKSWVTCKSLAEIRQNIDRLDAVIAPLLCERLHFVTQAANFKPSMAGVVVPSRVEEIVGKVRAAATALGASPDTIERVYRDLINAFTADEQHHWQKLNK
jgi:isochorismate pyruvate lyase